MGWDSRANHIRKENKMSIKKHLVVLRESFECDNNTPSDKVWAKITELDEEHLAQYEKRYVDEFNEDGPIDINVDFYPVSTVDEDWQKIAEIW